MIYDVCIVGSGAGASPIAHELVNSGANVCILEKGSIYSEKDFSKDELATVRRDIYTPNLKDEYHVIEELIDNKWHQFPTYDTGWSFWNGNILGGSSNFMSGFFYRLKPKDFKLASTFGNLEGANIVDWPITYDDLEPYYDKVEKIIGISGNVTPYKHQEPRSSKNFPYEALQEHPINALIDKSCKDIGYTPIQTPRAIVSKQKGNRNPCYYSNYCGSYACSSGAKSSGRASLIQPIIGAKNLTIISNAFVSKLNTNEKNEIKSATYINTKSGIKKEVKAKVFIIAAQAIESSRLLLNSKDSRFENGIANNSQNVGKNFLSTGGGFVNASIDESLLNKEDLFTQGLFVNRAIKDFYYEDNFKGGMIEMLWEHANPIRRARKVFGDSSNFIFGKELQDRIHTNFTTQRRLSMEIFTDWTPNDNSFISVNKTLKDKYGIPVANLRIGSHPQDVKIGNYLAKKGIKLFEAMGAKDIQTNISPLPSGNLQAGGCRFGDDSKTSVLNKYCQAHEVKNLFVTDGSFMPTGGSVPYTFTIYANSFRVADFVKNNFDSL